jgi:hypothetical protein
MKASEFRKLIREEVRKVLNEMPKEDVNYERIMALYNSTPTAKREVSLVVCDDPNATQAHLMDTLLQAGPEEMEEYIIALGLDK